MRVLLYTEKFKDVEKSGVGKAIEHQKKALKKVNIPYTTNEKDDYDIIHINTIFPKSVLIAKMAKSKDRKVIFHAHSTEEDFKNSFKFSNGMAPAFKQWLKYAYRQADLIITPTLYSKKLLDSYNLGKEIIPISNGIDLDFFQKSSEGAQKFRQKYGFKKDDKVIMAVGLYIERKGILEFLELAKRLPQYKFIWFGYTSSTLTTVKVNEAIKHKPSNVYFPGYVDSEELKNAYSGCDLYIFPTKEETEGIVLLEALAMKTKIIISDIPVYDRWLLDGVNVYKAKNIDDFEIKIKKIINNELPDLTDEGYKVAKVRSIENVGRQLKKVYEKVLEKNLV